MTQHLRRRLRMAIGLIVIAMLCLLPVCVIAQEPAPMAPPLALLDRTGKAVRLEAFRGRVVLVDFWATWCVPCRVSLPAYDDMLRTYQKQGFEVLAVDVGETRAQVDAFFKGREPLIRVLMDPQGAAFRSFRGHALPTTVLVDKDGYIRFTFVGFEEEALPRYHTEIRELLAEPPEQ